MENNRRNFLKQTLTSATGLVLAASGSAEIFAKTLNAPYIHRHLAPRILFSVIGVNHPHIYSMVDAVTRGGGQLVSFYVKEPDLAATFGKKYPDAKQVNDEKIILEDPTIQLVLSSTIANERAPLGLKVMEHGKDFMADKPGITTLEMLEKVKSIQKKTNRIYSILYAEHFENKATVKAGELVKAGAIGKVVQTLGLGPHRISLNSRPSWFFNKTQYGGILCDIGSHQCEQFLFFTGSTTAEVVTSQIANYNHKDHPMFEDFGDMMLKGNGGTGYVRVDWFTPDSLKTWGDGRLTILGTEGFIEVRKNIDIARYDSGNHLYMSNNKETKYIDCNDVNLPFGELLVNDIINRTETAMPQAHCFLAAELAIKAQKNAKIIA